MLITLKKNKNFVNSCIPGIPSHLENSVSLLTQWI